MQYKKCYLHQFVPVFSNHRNVLFSCLYRTRRIYHPQLVSLANQRKEAERLEFERRLAEEKERLRLEEQKRKEKEKARLREIEAKKKEQEARKMEYEKLKMKIKEDNQKIKIEPEICKNDQESTVDTEICTSSRNDQDGSINTISKEPVGTEALRKDENTHSLDKNQKTRNDSENSSLNVKDKYVLIDGAKEKSAQNLPIKDQDEQFLHETSSSTEKAHSNVIKGLESESLRALRDDLTTKPPQKDIQAGAMPNNESQNKTNMDMFFNCSKILDF